MLTTQHLFTPGVKLTTPTVPSKNRRWWWWLLLPLLGLLAALLVPLLIWLVPPTSLGQAQLIGVRPPSCLRLIVATDVSGSMYDLREPRDRAVAQLLQWAPKNLRSDDEVAVVSFAETAAVQLPPTLVTELGEPGNVEVGYRQTNLEPLLNTIAAMPPTSCRSALVLMGDGQFHDLAATEALARQQLVSAKLDDLALLVPGSTEVEASWATLYPYAPAHTFNGNDADATGVAIGTEIARLTGQKLVRTTNSIN